MNKLARQLSEDGQAWLNNFARKHFSDFFKRTGGRTIDKEEEFCMSG